ncbi:DUF1963 domain-containing protein [Deinococcus alpinitundrae]|uniref:DUF1963 domain-containing protein n=1 Tax=Deinococcus alpinitundrae TaxID=468913 RepID=UPI00137AF51A|nr:YwqG family protein [Deinococcus alpinitundrae]
MTEEGVLQLIAAHQLTEHTQVILELLRPAVYFTLGAAGEGLAHSRLGGRPDLPAELDWPSDEDGAPLTPLLQLSLQDIPVFAGNPFPSSGLLSVFVGLDESAWDVPQRVFLFEAESVLAPRPLPENARTSDMLSEVVPHHLKLELGMDLPRWATAQEDRLTQAMSSEQQSQYWALLRELEPKGTVGRLLGYAAGIGHDPRQDAYISREVPGMGVDDFARRVELDLNLAEHWQHLLTLNSINALDLIIWDAGYLQFLIKDSDLATLEFGQIYAAVETS